MSDEGSAQPVAAPPAEVNSAADNNTVGTKATDAPDSAAEAKAEGPNPTEKEAGSAAKEDDTPKQAEGKNSFSPTFAPAPAPANMIIC